MGGSKSVPSGRQDRKGFIEEIELELGTEARGRKISWERTFYLGKENCMGNNNKA